jgi:LacI family transcriptional regulator
MDKLMKKLTIKDIARMADVSIATVSMILNNKDESISPATRERVLEIIKTNNFITNKVARSLVTRQTKTIGLIISDITNPFYPELARGVEDKANETGYNVIICNTDNDINKEEKYLNMMAEKMVDGIILTRSANRTGDISGINRITLPFILVNGNAANKNVKGRILVSNEKGAYQAVAYLLDKGYRKIILINGKIKGQTSLERTLGYQRALREYGIDFNEEYVWSGHFKSNWGEEAVKLILERKIPFDAVFCGNDLIAIGAIKALKSAGFVIPDDVGVVGFDDIYMAKMVEPELTTVRQPNYEMGYKAAELLVGVLEKPAQTVERDIELPTELIVRKSTK